MKIYQKIGLNSKITINNNEYVVSGTIDKNYDTLYHSNNVNTILIPIDNYEGKINSYVVYVKDLNTIEKTVANLKNLFPNSVIQTQDHSIKLTIDSIKILQQVGMTYSVLLLIVVSIMIYMIYYRMILNQKYEILLLKANGLTKKEVRSYQHQLLLIFILITSILAYISFILAYILMKRYYNVNFDIPMFLGLILSILTSVIVNYLLSGISLERLNKISPSEMFRINI